MKTTIFTAAFTVAMALAGAASAVYNPGNGECGCTCPDGPIYHQCPTNPSEKLT